MTFDQTGLFDLRNLRVKVKEGQRQDPASEPPKRTRKRVTAARAKHVVRFVNELQRRKIEACRLYEPLPNQLKFHQSHALERLLRGSNRGGKTLPAAMEVAMAVTGRHPWIDYPKRNGRAFLVGKDAEHLGTVMWRKLSRSEPTFKRIKDPKTGKWRAYRPWQDEEIEHLAVPMEPLIPTRMIEDISWHEKKSNCPKLVKLINGWELSFYSSLGKPPQGQDIDLAWFDEEIIDPNWYPEISGRLTDRKGWFIWSATPQAATQQLFELHTKCEDQSLLEEPRAAEFIMRLDDNDFVTDEAKDILKEKLASNADAYRVRIEGEFLFTGIRVYPQFSKVEHVIPQFEVPKDWCRYMIVDPGHAFCAVMFCAVPPPPQKHRIVCYDTLYMNQCTAKKFAHAVRSKARGDLIQAFIIDDNGSRRTDAGTGKTLRQQYSEALREVHLKSIATGYGFFRGSNNVLAGLERCRRFLDETIEIDGAGLVPRFTIMDQCAEPFIREIGKYQKKRDRAGIVTDEPLQRDNHLMDCFRYAVMNGLRYVRPVNVSRRKSNGRDLLEAKRRRQRAAAAVEGDEHIYI